MATVSSNDSEHVKPTHVNLFRRVVGCERLSCACNGLSWWAVVRPTAAWFASAKSDSTPGIRSIDPLWIERNDKKPSTSLETVATLQQKTDDVPVRHWFEPHFNWFSLLAFAFTFYLRFHVWAHSCPAALSTTAVPQHLSINFLLAVGAALALSWWRPGIKTWPYLYKCGYGTKILAQKPYLGLSDIEKSRMNSVLSRFVTDAW